jgi:hypothetical protein
MRFLQPLEQFARSPPWLGLKPCAQQLRHPRERVGTPTPARGLLLWLAGRAHLAVLPCRAQSRQELLQRRRGRLRRFANDRTVGECNQLLLSFTDGFQQSNRIQPGIRRRCAAADVLVGARVGQQSLIGRGSRTRSSASNALSAISVSASIVGRRWSAPTRSCASPPVRKKPSGLPSASTSVWILVLSPPRERPIAWSSPAFFGRRRYADGRAQ